jgi:hypothetical protein
MKGFEIAALYIDVEQLGEQGNFQPIGDICTAGHKYLI